MKCNVCNLEKETHRHLGQDVCRECRVLWLTAAVADFQKQEEALFRATRFAEAELRVTAGLMADAAAMPMLRRALRMGGFRV